MRRKTRKLIYEALVAGIVLILFSGITIPKFFGAQNINTPKNFPDPHFRAAIEKYMGVPSGGRIPASAAARKTDTLSCRNAQINDLTGIEYFPNLNELNCSKNELHALNLSENHALTSIDCSQNQIRELDFTVNIRLQKIFCHKNNLREIRLPTSQSLTAFHCYENRLTELDLSTYIDLQDLRCFSNQIIHLSLPIKDDLKLFHYNENRLENVDLSHDTKLLYLHCANNRLSQLDVSHNPAIQRINCASNYLQIIDLSKNTQLAELNIKSNSLSKLDLHDTQVRTLICDSNQIEEIVFPKNPSFLFFVCPKNRLSNIQSLLDRFQGHFPGNFDIRYNDFSQGDLEILRDVMKSLFQRGYSTSNIQFWPQNGMKEEDIPEEWLSEANS